MSNALAIAAVTAVLRDLLNNALIDHDLDLIRRIGDGLDAAAGSRGKLADHASVNAAEPVLVSGDEQPRPQQRRPAVA